MKQVVKPRKPNEHFTKKDSGKLTKIYCTYFFYFHKIQFGLLAIPPIQLLGSNATYLAFPPLSYKYTSLVCQYFS